MHNREENATYCARFNELPNTNSAGMKIRVGSIVRIELGYGAWSINDPDTCDNSEYEGMLGIVDKWWGFDGEREFSIKIGCEGICVPARYVKVIQY